MNKRWSYLLLPGIMLLSGCLTTWCAAAAPAPAPAATPAAANPAAVATAKETEVKKWSLEECIYTALRNHGDVLASEQAAISAKAALTQAKGDYFPTITIQSMPLTLGGQSVLNNSALPISGTSVSVTQNVYDSGLRESNVKEKLYDAKSSESTLLRQRQTTSNNVISSYYSAWLAMRQEELQQTTMTDLEGQLDMIHTRVKVGDAAQSDAYPVEASLANAKVALLSAKNAIHIQLVALQDAMGIEPGGAFDIQDVSPPKKVLLDTMDKYQVDAVKTRPDLKANQAQIIAAKADEQAAKINLLPHLALNATYNNSIDHLSLNDYGISGGLVFNLFDGQKTRAQYQQAQAAVKSAQVTAVQLAKDIETQVQQAYLNIASAQENLDATEVGLEASEKNYEVQVAEYKEGLSTPQNVLDAQVQVATAKNNQVQAQYNYLTAKAALEYATGTQGGLNGK